MVGELDARLLASPEVNELAAPPYGGHLTLQEVRDSTAGPAAPAGGGHEPDNFRGCGPGASMECHARPAAWQQLTPRHRHEPKTRVADLPTELADEGRGGQGLTCCCCTQLSVLQAGKGFASLKDKIQAIAGALEEQTGHPAIKAEMAFIQAVAGEDWWQDVTVPMLEAPEGACAPWSS